MYGHVEWGGGIPYITPSPPTGEIKITLFPRNWVGESKGGRNKGLTDCSGIQGMRLWAAAYRALLHEILHRYCGTGAGSAADACVHLRIAKAVSGKLCDEAKQIGDCLEAEGEEKEDCLNAILCVGKTGAQLDECVNEIEATPLPELEDLLKAKQKSACDYIENMKLEWNDAESAQAAKDCYCNDQCCFGDCPGNITPPTTNGDPCDEDEDWPEDHLIDDCASCP